MSKTQKGGSKLEISIVSGSLNRTLGMCGEELASLFECRL